MPIVVGHGSNQFKTRAGCLLYLLYYNYYMAHMLICPMRTCPYENMIIVGHVSDQFKTLAGCLLHLLYGTHAQYPHTLPACPTRMPYAHGIAACLTRMLHPHVVPACCTRTPYPCGLPSCPTPCPTVKSSEPSSVDALFKNVLSVSFPVTSASVRKPTFRVAITT